MNTGKTLFAQLMDFLPWSTFDRIVARYNGNRAVRTLPCAAQYQVMAFAQITYRESLRDIKACLSAQSAKLYHMGLPGPIRRSTLADANETRDWRIYAEFAQRMIAQAKRLYAGDDRDVDLPQYRLCARHDNHRSVSVGVPMCTFPVDQGSGENAHAPRPARQHSKLHPHIRRQTTARCPCARHAASRTWDHLRHGSGLRGFRSPACAASGWRLLCDPGKVERRCPPGLFGTGRSKRTGDLRSDHRDGRLPHTAKLSHTPATHSLQGSGDRQDAGFSHRSNDAAGIDDLCPLQEPLAGGAVLQVDQA